MGIIDDSLFVLAQVYRNDNIGSGQLAEKMSWDHDRVEKALRFLEGDGLLKHKFKTLDGQWHMLRCSSEGIKAVEGDDYYKQKFNKEFNVNFITTVNVDALFKAQIDSIFKGSLF